MKKLGTVIRYECITSFKYIWIFYACVFAVISIISLIAYIATGSFDQVGTNALEVNSMVYVGILGVMGFKEDFKMLIQNGFTRKYIFLSTFSLFAFVSAIMALVDTVLGIVLHALSGRYFSLFAGLYGYEHTAVINWLWLFLVYMLVCCLFYLIILVVNKIGKTSAVYTGIILGLIVILIIPAIFRFLLPKEFTDKIMEYALKGIGFMTDGSINFINPVALLILLAGIFSIASYFVIRRTELKV